MLSNERTSAKCGPNICSIAWCHSLLTDDPRGPQQKECSWIRQPALRVGVFEAVTPRCGKGSPTDIIYQRGEVPAHEGPLTSGFSLSAVNPAPYIGPWGAGSRIANTLFPILSEPPVCVLFIFFASYRSGCVCLTVVTNRLLLRSVYSFYGLRTGVH